MSQSSKNQNVISLILCGDLDHEGGVITNTLDVLGLNWIDDNDEYIPLDEVLTKDILEKHSSEVLDKLPADNEYHEHLNHMVLGALILRAKAKMSQELKERILQALSWEAELKWRWKRIDKEKEKDFLEKRRNLIESFRQLIVNYQSKEIKDD